MRVLWFTISSPLYSDGLNVHNGGGWVASLEAIVRKEDSVQLGIAYSSTDSRLCFDARSVMYYPVNHVKRSILSGKKRSDNKNVLQYLKIVNHFKPDIIQIFGSENDFGLLCGRVEIPIVIHMQGCLPPYYNALFPIGMNSYDFVFQRGLDWKRRFMGLRSSKAFAKGAEREVHTIQHCRYFMGRTDWDKNLVELFQPEATYFHCEEALRDSFVHCEKQWIPTENKRVIIVSVISNPWYKGVDLILKTAALLSRFTTLDFEWQVYGVRDIRFYEKKYNIYADKVGVRVMGVASKDELVDALCSSTCYVHPSYIDNSPNSLCEAQYLGVPVLATNVGGISSLVVDGVSGLLFPANAPYTLASLIKKIVSQPQLAEELSHNAQQKAIERHHPEKIKNCLISIYQHILKNKNVQ